MHAAGPIPNEKKVRIDRKRVRMGASTIHHAERDEYIFKAS